MSQSARSFKADNSAPAASTQPEINRRILVVEDEPEIAKAYQAILTPEKVGNVIPLRRSSRQSANAEDAQAPAAKLPPYELTVVHSAAEAIQQVQDSIQKGQPFALGFIDVLLGAGMDGIELVKKIIEIDKSMYFVFVTAYQDRSVDSINELLGARAAVRWDYLTKPFSEGEILQKARNSISHWNLQRDKNLKEKETAELQRKLFDSERYEAVAAAYRGMGHEFGNILVQIIGRADIAKRKTEPEMREAFEKIIKAGEIASKVLDRFRNLARSSNSESEKTLIRTLQPIEDAILLLENQIKSSDTQINFIKKDPVLTVASSSSLTQVLINILINSMHAMGNKGKIDITVTRTPQCVEIKIRDHGPGIPVDILPRVTEAFFSTKGAAGTGLGLAICKEIVEIEHQGKFVIDNHPQGGLETVIQLPLAARKEGA